MKTPEQWAEWCFKKANVTLPDPWPGVKWITKAVEQAVADERQRIIELIQDEQGFLTVGDKVTLEHRIRESVT